MDFFVKSLNWLSDKEENISILSKDLDEKILQINVRQTLMLGFLSIILLPLIIILMGIIIWLKRKNS